MEKSKELYEFDIYENKLKFKKCPNCGAIITKKYCEYCTTVYEVEKILEYKQKIKEDEQLRYSRNANILSIILLLFLCLLIFL